MLKIINDIEVKEKEIFGFVGLVDSGRTTILKKIFSSNKNKINYVDRLPWYTFLKVKTILGKNKYHEYIKMLDLDIYKKLSDLNYNETRKLLFLLSVFTDKEIIILDEPLLLVENSTKKVMLDIISKLDKTILISFDNIKEAKLICDRYAIIKNYKIVEVKENKNSNDSLAINIKAKDVDKASLPLKNMKINYFSHNEMEFMYKGDINELIKKLANIKVDYIEIKPLSLEDLYKYYYKD